MGASEQRTAVVLAGGGQRVIAWQVGVIAGLADAGVDARRAGRIVGTSAGSHVAARLAGGDDMREAADRLAAHTPGAVAEPPADPPFERIARIYSDAETAREGRRRLGALALSAAGAADPTLAGLGGWRPPGEWPAALRIVAIDAVRGERVVLDRASGASVPVGVAASRAVPVLHRPVWVRGRQLIDGALGSASHADVAIADAGIARVVIVAALADDGHHPTLAKLWDDALRSEIARLDAAGVETYIVRANAADLEAMGPDPQSDARAPLAVAAGRAAGGVVGPALRDAAGHPPRAGVRHRRARRAGNTAMGQVRVRIAD